MRFYGWEADVYLDCGHVSRILVIYKESTKSVSGSAAMDSEFHSVIAPNQSWKCQRCNLESKQWRHYPGMYMRHIGFLDREALAPGSEALAPGSKERCNLAL